MLMDWFTVGAQALNFVVLVWLLKRFLYKPIMRAIDARERRIAADIAEADAVKAEAQKERDGFRLKNEIFDRERAGLWARAGEEAKAEGDRLLGEARGSADALSAKRRESLRDEAANLNLEILRRTRRQVFAIARKALADLATDDLEARMAGAFIRRLREMGDEPKALLAHALRSASPHAPALVRSAFDLPDEPRAAIREAIKENFSAEFPLRFETAPDLVGGIEILANGQKAGWTISGYLSDLEAGIREAAGAPAVVGVSDGSLA